MSFISTYHETEGLQFYPREKRLSIYRKVHRELLLIDPTYRRSCRQFTFVICGLILLPIIPQILWWVYIIPESVSAFIGLPLGIASLTLLLVTSSLAQHFRNISIAARIRDQRVSAEQDAAANP